MKVRKNYTGRERLSDVEYAKIHGNRAVAKIFIIKSEKSKREWWFKEESLHINAVTS